MTRRLGARHDPRDAAPRPNAISPRRRRGRVRGAAALVRCPVLVVHGDEDRVSRSAARSGRRADRRELVVMEGSGHAPHARDPVPVNRLIRDFADEDSRAPPAARTWVRGPARAKRALFVSSPIGLGHAWRDVAIADELRRARTRARDRVARAVAGHRPCSSSAARRSTPRAPSSPASPGTSSARRGARAARVRGAAPHGRDPVRELHGVPRRRHARRPSTSGSATRPGTLDHFLHENPELKTAAYAWLTDFVGFLPLPEAASARRSSPPTTTPR